MSFRRCKNPRIQQAIIWFFFYPSSPPLFSHPNKNSSSFFHQPLSFLLFSLLFFFSFHFVRWALPSFKMFHRWVLNILYFYKSPRLSDHPMLPSLACAELCLFISFSFFPSKMLSITQTIKTNYCKEMPINQVKDTRHSTKTNIFSIEYEKWSIVFDLKDLTWECFSFTLTTIRKNKSHFPFSLSNCLMLSISCYKIFSSKTQT